MDVGTLIKPLGIGLGLGLLVGLQRERANARIAGFRTFPLTTLLGVLCGVLGMELGGWVFGLGLVALAIVLLIGNLPGARNPEVDPGLTTEMGLLVMFAVGGCLAIDQTAVAVVVGGGVAILFHLKPQLHQFAHQIGERDIQAIMQFVLISLVILPVLPNRGYGPYEVLNPFRIWIMVVLIVGISLAGYILFKFFGQRLGALLSAILGGLVSSTATTVSYARRTRSSPDTQSLATFVILAASSVTFARVAVILGATTPSFLRAAWAPVALMFAVMLGISLLAWLGEHTQASHVPEQSNPTELKSALFFAALYALVLLAVAAARAHFGEQALYGVAALAGLTDMDAITLSISQMVGNGRVDPNTGWRLILVAGASNLVFKGIAVALLGNRRLAWRVGLFFGLALVAAGAIICLW